MHISIREKGTLYCVSLIFDVKLPDRCAFSRNVKDICLRDIFHISSVLNSFVLSNIFGSTVLEGVEPLQNYHSNYLHFERTRRTSVFVSRQSGMESSSWCSISAVSRMMVVLTKVYSKGKHLTVPQRKKLHNS